MLLCDSSCPHACPTRERHTRPLNRPTHGDSAIVHIPRFLSIKDVAKLQTKTWMAHEQVCYESRKRLAKQCPSQRLDCLSAKHRNTLQEIGDSHDNLLDGQLINLNEKEDGTDTIAKADPLYAIGIMLEIFQCHLQFLWWIFEIVDVFILIVKHALLIVLSGC